MRLTPADLATLCCFLFGRRWQTALARALPVDVRLVRRWARGERAVSERCAALVIALVRARRAAHDRRFCTMVASLACAEARDRLLDRPVLSIILSSPPHCS